MQKKGAGQVFLAAIVVTALVESVAVAHRPGDAGFAGTSGMVLAVEAAANGSGAGEGATRRAVESCPAASPLGYYVATDGVDVGDHGTADAPWRSLGYALSRLKAGDTLYVRGGTYYEHDLVVNLSGTPSAPITIQGYPCEEARIDGGFPLFRQENNDDWEIFDSKIEEWRSRSAVAAGDKAKLVFGFIVGISDYRNERVRLVPYAAPEHLRTTNEVHVADENDAKPIYVGPGVWRDPATGRIHIRLVNNVVPVPLTGDPRKISLHLSTASSVLKMSNAAHLTLRNLTLQNARSAFLLEGVNHHLVFERITTWALSGIDVRDADGTTENSFITVSQSRFYNDYPAWVYWSDVKRPPKAAGLLETGAIRLRNGSHDWDISWNHFRGGFDGPSQRDNTHNIKYHHNLVEAYADDAFELEGDCVNAQVYENYIRHTFVGVAVSPCVVGPVFV
ncbi:MAG TPA: hypothetical protein VJL59_03230, partial [Anaerolineales bacterium]|nr:hypothetical protein [Anaerolineales bacterium]